MADAIVRLAAEARRHVAIPITMIVAAVVFLLLQSRFDRRDPKLHLAPVSRSHWVWIPRIGSGRP